MKARKQEARKAGRAPAKTAVAIPSPSASRWPYALGFLVALAAAFQVYGPSLNGPFLFDDRYLPFSVPNFPVDSLRSWLVGVRPVLMFSYWLNCELSGIQNTLSFHAFNVVFHTANSVLVFFVTRKIMEFAQVERARRDLAAVFAGAVFLLHPVNSESVGYVASRSENLSVLMFFAAFTVFLYRRAAEVSWLRAASILALFATAVLTKEHTIALPGLLLLTDYFWSPPFSFAGIRRNWRLYAPILVGGLLAASYLLGKVRHDISAGFAVKDFTWYQYFFTQCRAFWIYIRLFVFPVGLRIDYDFPTSRTILDHGAIIGLAAILAAAGVAFYFRRRFPLAAYGFFAFVILMAPTSSFIPIKDPVAERRLYLSMIGLLFIVLEWLRRADLRQPKWLAALAVLLLVAGVLTYQRNFVWSDAVVLWEDAVAKSPGKARDQFQLAQAYYERGDCGRALPYYERSAQLDPSDDRLYIDWGLAYDCLNQPDQAIAKFRQAAKLRPTAHVYSQIGMIFGKQGRNEEALEALAFAEKLDPNFDVTYLYRGGVRQNMGDLPAAIRDFEHALSINPHNQQASTALAAAQAQLQNRR